MGITISYPDADLYYGAQDGTLSGEDAYAFFRQYGYWPNDATRNAGLSYIAQQGLGTNIAGTMTDPNDQYAGFELTSRSPTLINGIYYAPQYDAQGTFLRNQVTDAQGNPIQQQQTDWYAEAAAGRPVIGASVPAGSPDGSGGLNFADGTTWSQGQPNPYNQGQLAYPPGGGLPTPDQFGGSNVNPATQANLSVGQGLTDLGSAITGATNRQPVTNSISNFWDAGSYYANTGNSNNPYSPTPQGTNMQDLFQKWFKDTYGSDYGMGG